jgi:hypothetical protein
MSNWELNAERERLLRELVESLDAVELGLTGGHGQRLLTVSAHIMAAVVASNGVGAVWADATRYAKEASAIAEALLVEVGAAVARAPRFTLPPEVRE